MRPKPTKDKRMSKPSINLHPSLETNSSLGETHRPSLFDAKDEFIGRIAPFATAAIYFGSFALYPQDISLSRQALFKLSFLNRHFLQPGGLRITVEKQTACFSGNVTSHSIPLLADILARQIEGIRQVKDETVVQTAAGAKKTGQKKAETIQKSIQSLLATDQTLRSGVVVSIREGRHLLEGEVGTSAQKNWAEQLAGAVGGDIESKLKIGVSTADSISAETAPVDDESLQALILFRLRLLRDTEHLPVKVTANRGIVAIQGKVNTEALRQRVENIARSTLGVRELRSSLSIPA
jgi:osmotically-inducible protein OsmY